MTKLRNLWSLSVMAIAALAAISAILPLGASAHEAQPHTHAFVGMWVTADGSIRHELLANGRYDEARGSRRKAYRGRYEISGNRINYWDDTGFTADGTFVGKDELHHGGMIFHRTE